MNGDYQVDSDHEEVYHEFFAHVPVILGRAVPRRVLVLGGGDGILVRELLKYPGIERIVLVDIDPTIVDLARTHPVLTGMNHRALDDPRVRVEVGDGYYFVRKSTELFDGIYIDFPYVMDYDVSKLYSSEFYRFVRERMSEHGFAVLDAPDVGLFTEPEEGQPQEMAENNDWPVMQSTIRKSGFATVVPYVSNLEMDNERALEALRAAQKARASAPGKHRRGRREDPEAQVRRSLAKHVIGLQYGFIMVRRDSKELAAEYWDPGIEMHVLNEERFRLAFSLPFPDYRSVDPALVNSIMRPTLPTLDFFFTRMPW